MRAGAGGGAWRAWAAHFMACVGESACRFLGGMLLLLLAFVAMRRAEVTFARAFSNLTRV